MLITVAAVGAPEVRYRAWAAAAERGAGSTVVAVPLREADQALGNLLRAEALVIAGVLAALAALAWWLLGVGPAPARPHRRHRGGHRGG